MGRERQGMITDFKAWPGKDCAAGGNACHPTKLAVTAPRAHPHELPPAAPSNALTLIRSPSEELGFGNSS